MDFFALQEKARQRTWWLVVLFFSALAGLILTAYLALVYTMQAGGSDSPEAMEHLSGLWHPQLLLGVSSVISLIVLSGTTIKLLQLRQGGGQVAEMLGGRMLDPSTRDFHERRLLNVVEEMAIASGVPVPPVYVMPEQMGINAFAAGYSFNDAVVGITEGAMLGLKREELQGVIGHEFSHILNGDMRLNIRLMGVLHGLLALVFVGQLLIRLAGSGNSRSKNRGAVVLAFIGLGLALIIIGYAGYFFGGLIKRAVSRQREYLADASAVQYTRNPLGLASALMKIGGLEAGGAVRHARAQELSHMFFTDGIKRFFGEGSLFATHPPLARRVKLLDPGFDGVFPPLTEEKFLASGRDEQGDVKKEEAESRGREFIRRSLMMGGAMAADPAAVIGQAGVVDAGAGEAAAELVGSLPVMLREAAREPVEAQALIMAVFVGMAGEEVSMDDWSWVPAAMTEMVGRYSDLAARMDPSAKLVLVDLALPTLRMLSREQAVRFLELLEKIVHADDVVNLQEFALLEMIRAGLRETLGLKVGRIRRHRMEDITGEVSLLFSIMARAGHSTEEEVRHAFDHAVTSLGIAPDTCTLLAPSSFTLVGVKAALDRLRESTMPLRGKVLEACLACLMFDKEAVHGEVCLFKAFAATLEVPIPPGAFLGSSG